MRAVGFDGKSIKRSIKVTHKPQDIQFQALLGIAVTVNDYAMFIEKYDKIIEKFFAENALIRSKPLYKSADLLSLFYGKGIDLLPLIVNALLDLADGIDIYFHHVPQYYNKDEQTENRIGVYYEEEIEHLTNIQFLNLIENHFPALCCYSYIDNLTLEINGTSYYIDECTNLLQSKAITSIIKHPNTKFLYRGDQVNYIVNAADIICRYVDETSKKQNILINEGLISSIGFPKEKVNYHFIGPKWLNSIKPARRAKLNISHKYPHPIYFMFNQSSSFAENSKNIIENSILYREVLKKAANEGGSVKFFEAQDQEYIQESDFLVTHTKEVDEKCEELIRMGCPAKKIDYKYFK